MSNTMEPLVTRARIQAEETAGSLLLSNSRFIVQEDLKAVLVVALREAYISGAMDAILNVL